MRRKDREVMDQIIIDQIIEKCQCCRIGMIDEDEVYIIPMNFGYSRNNEGKSTFYFHGAKVGRKIHLILKNKKATFELDIDHKLNESKEACGYSYKFASVMGVGKISIIAENDEKKNGLNTIMKHYTKKLG
ncbi:pyridoxamine 5'-phosphate oxidase family protein [Fusobacterium sp. PH5-44]|uniref:pyridoxamine 5'-phosphate oxidase family protein n=1 Tax=unclassified Fusobacterium TaxID=2648384 RepID=UPI003D25078E